MLPARAVFRDRSHREEGLWWEMAGCGSGDSVYCGGPIHAT